MNTICAFCCVKDSEWSIQAWYANVKDNADQIVIQDGGSTDGTRELLIQWAKENPKVTVLLQDETWDKFKWNEQEVRNQCLSLFKTDWTLLMDADELIEDRFWEWFKNTDHDAEIERVGYYIAHKNLWLQRDQFNIAHPWFPDYTLRLFKNHRTFWWVGSEHASLWRIQGMCKPEDLDTPIAGSKDDPICFIHYHRAEEGYKEAVLNDKILHHSGEKDNVMQKPILARLRQHPTGAGLIRRRFE